MYVILDLDGFILRSGVSGTPILVFRDRQAAQELLDSGYLDAYDRYTIRPILQGTKIPERMIP